jgi:hypothetical protein
VLDVVLRRRPLDLAVSLLALAESGGRGDIVVEATD